MPHYKSSIKSKETFCKNHGLQKEKKSIEKKICLFGSIKCNNQIAKNVLHDTRHVETA